MAQSITTILAVKAGLGKNLDLLTKDSLNEVAVVSRKHILNANELTLRRPRMLPTFFSSSL